MDIALNPESWGREQADGAPPRLDWHGLRARFMAGYALRGASPVGEPRSVSGGSFNRESARILSTYGLSQAAGLASVNRTGLGNGNSPGGKNVPVPGNKRPAIEE